MPIHLQNHAWSDIEANLHENVVVIFPLGAALKEHGRHLLLSNDQILAQELANRIQGGNDLVITPCVSFFYYPAFLSYPGSTSVGAESSANYLWDICRSLSLHGPRRFYVLNTGLSTGVPLRMLQRSLLRDGLLMQWLDIEKADARLPSSLLQQVRGSHADEAETSMMLYLAPDKVDMVRAESYTEKMPAFSRIHSPSGVFGDATLATREKGRVIVSAWLRCIQEDIENLRGTTLPVRR